jgi:hypothetical protein
VRNPQRFAWDPRTNAMYLADIGQNIVEELSPVTAGANLGWNVWEGSFRFISRQAVELDKPRSDSRMTYPIAEYGQVDPLLQGSSAATGVIVYRGTQIKQLANLILFGDNPSGEVFYVSADTVPAGGQDPIRRVLFTLRGGEAKTFLELIREKNASQGRGQRHAPTCASARAPTARCSSSTSATTRSACWFLAPRNPSTWLGVTPATFAFTPRVVSWGMGYRWLLLMALALLGATLILELGFGPALVLALAFLIVVAMNLDEPRADATDDATDDTPRGPALCIVHGSRYRSAHAQTFPCAALARPLGRVRDVGRWPRPARAHGV